MSGAPLLFGDKVIGVHSEGGDKKMDIPNKAVSIDLVVDAIVQNFH
jgi:hypothetical protein